MKNGGWVGLGGWIDTKYMIISWSFPSFLKSYSNLHGAHAPGPQDIERTVLGQNDALTGVLLLRDWWGKKSHNIGPMLDFYFALVGYSLSVPSATPFWWQLDCASCRLWARRQSATLLHQLGHV